MIYDLLIFTNNPKAYAPQRIKQELEKRGKSCAIVKYGEDFPAAKNIFFRDFGEGGEHIDLIKKLNSSKVINHKSFQKWLTLNKVTQYEEFVKADIPAVATSLNSLKYDFPFIAKVNNGSQGRGVKKIINKKTLDEFLNENSGETILFQPFLKAGEDLRVVIVGGKVLGGMRRIAQKGEYLTNYSMGGEVVNYDMNKDFEASKISKLVAKYFKLDYCGVDLMKGDDGKWKVLEVNRACQFKGFELSTQINVTSEIASYLGL